MKHLLPKTTLRALALTLFVGIAAESSAHSDIVDYKHELEADGYDFGNSIILPIGITFGLKWRLR